MAGFSRESFGDRVRMEGELTPSELGALTALCEAHSIRRDGWHESPLAPQWEGLAWDRRVRRLMDLGATQTNAEMSAAVALGLNEETMRKRWRRWAAATIRRAA